MGKIYSYLLGFGLTLLIAVFIAAFVSWNHIYVWFLGDVDTLYKEAIHHYKNRQYDKALPLLEKMARIDTASYCKLVLADMYYRGMGTHVDYERAFELYEESAELDNYDAHNNLAICMVMEWR